jgi:hypothetical protein
MLLADAAQAAAGKLYVLGGGWSVCGPDPTAMALAIKIEVPWDRANQKHRCQIDLIDADGQPVQIETPEGLRPVQMSADFEVGRPPGLKPGTPIDLPLAINVGPMPIPPGGRYEWRLSIDGETQDEWRVVFSTRPSGD